MTAETANSAFPDLVEEFPVMLRFSLASLLAIVVFFSIGSAAVANATDLWRQIMVTLTVSGLLLATLAAFFSQDRARLFAGGFAMTGWLYITLTFVNALGLRDDLFTHQVVLWAAEAVNQDDGASAASVELALDYYDTRFVIQGNGTFAEQTAPFRNLTAIGHALWTAIVGWLGGLAAVWLARRNISENETSS